MNFQYKVRDASGKIISDYQDAPNRSVLIKSLEDRGLRPIAVIPAAGKAKSNPEKMPASSGPKSMPVVPAPLGAGVKTQEVVFFTRDLYTLIHSGTPLISGLKDIQEQIRNPYFARVMHQVIQDVESGSKLSEALERHRKVFSEIYTSSIRVGEQTGRLEKVLSRLIMIMEREIESHMTVKNALRYPLIVIGFIFLAFGVIVTFVIPKIASIFSKMNGELPLATKLIIGLGNFSQNYWPILLVSGVLIFILFQFWKNTPSGRYQWHTVLLKIPVFGDLISKAALSKFASTMEILHESGLVLPECLILSSRVVGNDVIARGIMHAHEEVIRGRMLSEVLKENKRFPALVVRMIMTGEKTGNLDEMLEQIMLYYDREIQHIAKSMTSMIEPLITIVLGVMILVLALGVFLPLWNVFSLMTGSR